MSVLETGNPPEIHFYHLERLSLESVLPFLLEKIRKMAWRSVVQVGSDDRVRWLSHALWSWREDSFLPHGSKEDGFGDLQPVWLTAESDYPNAPHIQIVSDGRDIIPFPGIIRLLYLFNGQNPLELERARNEWRKWKALGAVLIYWQQTPEGQWIKR